MEQYLVGSAVGSVGVFVAFLLFHVKKVAAYTKVIEDLHTHIVKARKEVLELVAIGVEVLRSSEAVERKGGCFEAGTLPHHGKFCNAPSQRCNCSRDAWEAAVEALAKKLTEGGK